MPSLYIHGDYATVRATLNAAARSDLEAHILNAHYNGFLGDLADWGPKDEETHGDGGKRIPYIGWYWRSVDFASRHIPIGNCGDFIGFMENNKWGYPQRRLTDDEVTKVVALADAISAARSTGGVYSDILAATDARCKELWDYMQTLNIEKGA